jgi:DNA-binding response OmpR family regulator
MVRRQLGGHIECRWPPEGLVCAISLPLARVTAPPDALRPTSRPRPLARHAIDPGGSSGASASFCRSAEPPKHPGGPAGPASRFDHSLLRGARPGRRGGRVRQDARRVSHGGPEHPLRGDRAVPSVRPVLVVEDDPSQRATLAAWLAADGGGFAVEEAGSAAEAEARLAAPDAARCDAVLLDVGLPDGDGCALGLRLRRRGLAAPVILLSGADGEADVVRGLAAGADDYVAKPYRPAELLARLRAQLRAFDAGPDAPRAVGPYEFRPATRLLIERATGRRVPLTAKEAALLLRLCRAGGAPVARRALLGEVFDYAAAAAVDTRTLETHVYRLRQKIEADPATPSLLLMAGRGMYRIAGLESEERARRRADAAAPSSGAAPAP